MQTYLEADICCTLSLGSKYYTSDLFAAKPEPDGPRYEVYRDSGCKAGGEDLVKNYSLGGKE